MRKSRGFTLVELMITVSIVGIMVAGAIYGVAQYRLHSGHGQTQFHHDND